MKLKLDSLLDYKFLGDIKVSDKGLVAYQLAQANLKKNGYDKQLWIYDPLLRKNKAFTSTQFDGFYSFDGERVLFSAKREETDGKKEGYFETQLYSLPLDGGEASLVKILPFKPMKVLRLDEDQLLFLGVWKEKKQDPSETKDPLLKSVLEASVEVIDEIPYWANNQGFRNKVRNRLFLFNEKKNSLEAITSPFTNIMDFDLDAKTKEVFYLGNTYQGAMDVFQELHYLDLKTMEDKRLLEKSSFHYSFFGILDDEDLLFVGSDGKLHGLNQDQDIYLLNRKTMKKKLLSPKDWEASLWNSVGSDVRLVGGLSQKIHQGSYYFVTTEFDHSYLNVLHKDGKLEKLTTEKGSVDCFNLYDDKIYAVLMRGMDLEELYEIKNGKEKKLTSFNQKANKLPRARLETIPYTYEGVEYLGYMLLPQDYDPKKKYPGILTIHGGPKTAYGQVFFHELHYFAQQGYMVFFTNPRGSDGRGRDFSDIRGKYGTIDYEDLMHFTDLVIKKYPNLDKNRLGVMGGSYGGFMTNWIISHTNRFAAACSQRSISNWVSKFGITDIGYYFNADQHQATPWENFEGLWEASPLKHAQQAKTPTLFIHSDEDYRCHYSCAMQMHTALKLQGVDSRLVLFHGENHELSRSGKPKERLRRIKEIEDWFQKYLKGKSPQFLP